MSNPTNKGVAFQTGSPGVCMGDFHAYPTSYAGSPQYAAQFFSRCLCGKKKKVTTVIEVDTNPSPTDVKV